MTEKVQMQNYLEFVQVDLPNKTSAYVQVNGTHLDVFGIHPKLASLLRLADQGVREIADDGDVTLDSFDLAYHMAVPVPGQPQTLPLNQCVRWQLLRHTLGELTMLREKLGVGLVDTP